MAHHRHHEGAGPLSKGAEKTFFLGTHRTCSPEETWARISPGLDRFGISRVADVTRLDRIGIPVFQAIRPRSLNLSVSQGKGVSAMAARVSAVMEAIELWHVEDLSDAPQEDASNRWMAERNSIPLGALRWLADARSFSDLPMPWIRLRSATRDRDGWLPRQMVELDFSAPDRLLPRMFMQTSNGLASGNTADEARLHGLYELIERHGVFLAKQNPGGRTAVDPDSIDTPYCRNHIDQIVDAEMKLAIYDLTWEVDVPTVLVELVADDLPVVWRGSGTHLCPEVALSRALTEAAQSRLTFISGARDDLPELAPGLWTRSVFESFRAPEPRRRFDELADLSTSEVGRDLERVIEKLEARDLEPFSVDLTRARPTDPGFEPADLGISVVLSFVPGLMEVGHG